MKTLRKLYHRVLCAFGRHRRGRRLIRPEYEAQGESAFQCPACGRVTTRKQRVKA